MSSTAAVRMAVGLVGVLLAAGGLAGCGGDQPARPAATTAAATTAAASTWPGRVDAERCPVSLPRNVGPPGVSPRDLFGWASSYGNGRL
jgi:hypothetical protein